MSNETVLSVEGIVKRFPGTLALNRVRIEVKKGQANALVGENGAGKSTLMNIISGVLKPDEGTITFMGEEVRFDTPDQAQKAGIGFVHQELSLCPHLSVSENIYMGRTPKNKFGLLDKKRIYEDSDRLLKLFHARFSPDTIVGTLNIADQQIVEIAKALSLDCKLIIFDEPTSSLTESETETLFNIIDNIKKKGISVLYVSHRMAEIFRVCDYCTVFKDGNYVDTVRTADVTTDDLIRMMVGRNIEHLYPEKSSEIGEVVLEVKDFTSKDLFCNVSFQVKRGEILGFYGLVGAGRTEVLRAVCGIDRFDSGTVYLNGKKTKIDNYKDAINKGFAYLTEDRKGQGLFLELSIAQNISAAKLEIISKNKLIKRSKERSLCIRYVNDLNIKIASITNKVASLSGGNQQKVMIGKWLAIDPKILIMDEPTRGIDVGAKSEIHNMLRELSNQGITVIIISSELPEIIGMSDRIVVMHEGSVTGEIMANDMSEETIITYASGEVKCAAI